MANSNYVLFSNVLPNGSNNITGTMTTNGASSFGVFNGLQIVFTEAAVPEPSTYALGLIGLVGLGLVVWRKRSLLSDLPLTDDGRG